MSTPHIHVRVTPSSTLMPEDEPGAAPEALLAPSPLVMLGGPRVAGVVDSGVLAAPGTCFGPRGAALLPGGGFLIADTGHHRVLGWTRTPVLDQSPADWLVGQPDFCVEGRNARREPDALTMNVPTGISPAGSGFAVADAWNHRVLVWDCVPETSNQAPDRVFGQADFTRAEANRGRQGRPGADTLFWPYGVHVHGPKLFVADAENRRVLIWDDYRADKGAPARVVLGQRNFITRDENAGAEPGASSMRWPHGIAVWNGRLCVADAGNNRIMVWDGIPDENGAPCDWILGQPDAAHVDHNQSLYWPRANCVNMPYGLAACGDWLIVADTANSRLLGWHSTQLATNAPARALAGQPAFTGKGDNRWQAAAEDSFCWPYGLACLGNRLAVADSGNNRVSLWELAV